MGSEESARVSLRPAMSNSYDSDGTAITLSQGETT
jgi:hypothetical protein